MHTKEINKQLIEECGFILTHEFNRSTFKNMVALHGIHDNIPTLVKKDGDTILYGNVNLEIHQVDGMSASFVLTVCKTVKKKYGRGFNQCNEMLIRVSEFTTVEDVKEKIRNRLTEFHRVNRS